MAVSAFQKQSVPLYHIRCYGDYLFRVTKRLFDASIMSDSAEVTRELVEKPVGKFDSALSRAKNLVREVALCNEWQYFVTLTFDKDKVDRYDLKERLREFLQWVQNLNKSGYNIRYLLVPEFHKDGAVHFHALMSGITPAPRPAYWPASVNRKDDGTYYDIWPEYSERYGYSSVDAVCDPVAVGFYITKYMTKSMANSADLKGFHTYYRSRGLERSSHVCSIYHHVYPLDCACKFSNDFYSFGFFSLRTFDKVMDCVSCDEVGMQYRNYVITDPVSGEYVAAVGGDEEDVYVQEMLAAFKTSGMCCSVWDCPD